MIAIVVVGRVFVTNNWLRCMCDNWIVLYAIIGNIYVESKQKTIGANELGELDDK